MIEQPARQPAQPAQHSSSVRGQGRFGGSRAEVAESTRYKKNQNKKKAHATRVRSSANRTRNRNRIMATTKKPKFAHTQFVSLSLAPAPLLPPASHTIRTAQQHGRVNLTRGLVTGPKCVDVEYNGINAPNTWQMVACFDFICRLWWAWQTHLTEANQLYIKRKSSLVQISMWSRLIEQLEPSNLACSFLYTSKFKGAFQI